MSIFLNIYLNAVFLASVPFRPEKTTANWSIDKIFWPQPQWQWSTRETKRCRVAKCLQRANLVHSILPQERKWPQIKHPKRTEVIWRVTFSYCIKGDWKKTELHVSNLLKRQNSVFSFTFTPNLPIFLHWYIRLISLQHLMAAEANLSFAWE